MRNNILSRQPRKIKFNFMDIYNDLLPHVTLNLCSVQFNSLIYYPSVLEQNIVLKLFWKTEKLKGTHTKHIYLLHKKTMQSKQIMINNYIFITQTMREYTRKVIMVVMLWQQYYFSRFVTSTVDKQFILIASQK